MTNLFQEPRLDYALYRLCNKHGIQVILDHACGLCLHDIKNQREDMENWILAHSSTRWPEGAEL